MVDLRELDGRDDESQHPDSANGALAIRGQESSNPVLSAQSIPAQTAVTPGDSATAAKRAAEKAVRAQTFKFSLWLRTQLRYEAWRAKQTGAQSRLLWWLLPMKYDRRSAQGPDPASRRLNGFEEYFANNASLFGDSIYDGIKPRISSLLAERLGSLINSDGEPFLIIRGVFSRRFLQASLTRIQKDNPEKAEALLEKDHLVAAALIAATKTSLRRKLDAHTPYRDYFTEVSAEINQFDDRPDMHLRYRTASPELPPAPAGLNTAARIIVFACIENPIADPIYLIRADEVIRAMPAEKRDLLYQPDFDIFDRWTRDIRMQPGPGDNKSILHRGTDWLSFDPNRVCPANIDAIHNSAIGALLESIRTVAAKSARKIVLRRGDALIVDNYRALTRRQEHGYASFVVKSLWMRGPPIRWLRAYYGFPRSRAGG
jgi:hypothetical protein